MLNKVVVCLAYENRVPDVNHAVDFLLDVLNNKGNEKQNDIASHDVEVSIVDCRLDRVAVAARQLGNRLDKVSKISRG